jgi:hypothetical protein
VLVLAEEHPGAQINNRADVHGERAKVIQQRYPTMRLKANAKLKDVLWELELLLPEKRKVGSVTPIPSGHPAVSYPLSGGWPPNLPALVPLRGKGCPTPLRSKGWDKITADAERFASFSQYWPRTFHSGLKPGASQRHAVAIVANLFQVQHAVTNVS